METQNRPNAGSDVRTSDIGLRTSLYPRILSLLKEGHSQASITTRLQKPRQTINSALKTLESYGIITAIGSSRPRTYEINEARMSELCPMSEDTQRLGTYCYHNFIFTAPFIPGWAPLYHELDGKGAYEFKGGKVCRADVKFGSFYRGQERLANCTVETNPTGILIRLPGYRNSSGNAMEMISQAFNEAYRVVKDYSERYGTRLGLVVNKHVEIARPRKLWENKGPRLNAGNGVQVHDDNTPDPDTREAIGPGAEEYINIDKEVPYIVQDIDKRQRKIEQDLERIHAALQQLNGGVTISQLVNMQFRLEQKLDQLITLLQKLHPSDSS